MAGLTAKGRFDRHLAEKTICDIHRDIYKVAKDKVPKSHEFHIKLEKIFDNGKLLHKWVFDGPGGVWTKSLCQDFEAKFNESYGHYHDMINMLREFWNEGKINNDQYDLLISRISIAAYMLCRFDNQAIVRGYKPRKSRIVIPDPLEVFFLDT